MTTSEARWEELLNKRVDDLLSDEERDELEGLLTANPERGTILDDLLLIKGTTDGIRERILQDAQLEPRTPSFKAGLGLGVVLIVLSLALIFAVGVEQAVTDPNTPLVARVGICILIGGAALILGLLGATRVRSFKQDPYREVDQ